MEPVQSVQVTVEEMPYTDWYKHNAPNSSLFKRQVTGKECKIKTKSVGCELTKLIPLEGIADSIAFNPPSDLEYGCFSNWYPLKQTLPLKEKITPLKNTLEECGFKGTMACAAIGFTLLRVLIDGDNDKNKINKDHLAQIFKVNDRLIQIMDAHKGHISTWKDGRTEWNNQLKKVTAIKDILPYPFAPEKEKIVFGRFVEEILLVKFKSDPQLQKTLLSIKGFFIDAAPGDNVYGIGLSLREVIPELKAAEAEGRRPFYDKNDDSYWDGINLQGLALEKARDKIQDEINQKKESNQKQPAPVSEAKVKVADEQTPVDKKPVKSIANAGQPEITPMREPPATKTNAYNVNNSAQNYNRPDQCSKKNAYSGKDVKKQAAPKPALQKQQLPSIPAMKSVFKPDSIGDKLCKQNWAEM